MKRILLFVLLAVMLVSPALADLMGTGTSATPSLPVEWTFSADSTNEYYEFGFASVEYSPESWDGKATSNFNSKLSLTTKVEGQDVYAINDTPCYVYWKIRSNKAVTLTLAVADSEGKNPGSKLATTATETGTTDLDWIVLWTSGESAETPTVIGSAKETAIGHYAGYSGTATKSSDTIKSFATVSDATTMRTEQGSQQIFISTDDVAKDQVLGTYSGSLVLTISTSS